MKKLAALILSIVLLCSVACAEVDLSAYNYDQLLELSQQIQREIMSRPEWKEVTVPKGIYVIGEDIPEGAYTLVAPDDQYGLVRIWGYAVEDYSKNGGLIFSEQIGDDEGMIGRVEFKKGQTLELTCIVVFSPVKSLGF